MPAELRMRFAGRQASLNRLLDRFHVFAADHRLPPAAERDAHLVLDEIVSNVIRYGGTGVRLPRIDVRAAVGGGVLRISVVDDGRAFNPLAAAPAPVLEGAPPDRPVGGLGIHLTTKLMDRVEYRRTNGRNRMTLVRAIGRSTERAGSS